MTTPEALRPRWRDVRARLERAGFHPSKTLGQNFLLDEGLAAAIARDGEVEPGDPVLEVGVGCGFLSAHLLAAGARLVGVEIDERLQAVAREVLEPLLAAHPAASFTLVEGDALAGKHALAPAVLAALPGSGPWRVVSNLPYGAGSPVLACLARLANPPRTMTVLVQREVAERLVARAGTKAWGPLGARIGLAYAGEIVRAAPANLFWPRPRVESAVVRLRLREDRPEPELAAALDVWIGSMLQQRRKVLRRSLERAAGGREAAIGWLAEAGVDEGLRSEALDREGLLRLGEAGMRLGIPPSAGR